MSGASGAVTATVSGNGVTIRNTGSEKVSYSLSGTTTNGYLKIYSEKKQALIMNGVSITNPNGAAINIQDGSTYIQINGTNSLADGSSYTTTPADEDEKAALFSEDQLIFSGNGSLTITATGKSGIASDDYIIFSTSPTITVNSIQAHGIKANDYIIINGGRLNITTSAAMKKGLKTDGSLTMNGGNVTISCTGGTAYDDDDQDYTGSAGIKTDGEFIFNGGTLTITNSGQGGKGINCNGEGHFNGGILSVTCSGNNYGNGGGWWGSSNSVSAKGIKCDGDITFDGAKVYAIAGAHEAIESKSTITINSGEVYAYSKDDAINSASTFTINGGYVCGHSTGNDGLDANGNFYIKGGVVYAIGTTSPEVAIDANTEGGYKLYIQGGTIITIGPLENGSQLSQNCYQASSWSKNTWYTLTIGSTDYSFKTPSSGGNKLVVSGNTTSAPTLKSGTTVSGGTEHFNATFQEGGTVSGGSSVSLSTYSGGGGGWH